MLEASSDPRGGLSLSRQAPIRKCGDYSKAATKLFELIQHAATIRGQCGI